MSCPNVRRLCDHLIISTAVTFAGGVLTINIPAGVYSNGCKYCLVVAQAIPAATTITAPVVITIGAGATTYALVDCAGNPVTAGSINTRTRYTTVVNTNTTTGVFRLLGRAPCSHCANNLASLPVAGG